MIEIKVQHYAQQHIDTFFAVHIHCDILHYVHYVNTQAKPLQIKKK